MNNSFLSFPWLSDPVEILSASVRMKVPLVANPVLGGRQTELGVDLVSVVSETVVAKLQSLASQASTYY